MNSTPQPPQEQSAETTEPQTFEGLRARFLEYREALKEIQQEMQNRSRFSDGNIQMMIMDLIKFYKAVEKYETAPEERPSIENLKSWIRKGLLLLQVDRVGRQAIKKTGEHKQAGEKARQKLKALNITEGPHMDMLRQVIEMNPPFTPEAAESMRAYRDLADKKYELGEEIDKLWKIEDRLQKKLEQLEQDSLAAPVTRRDILALEAIIEEEEAGENNDQPS